MIKMVVSVIFALAAIVPSGTNASTVLFENDWDSSVNPGAALCSSCGGNYRAAELFSLESNTTITAIEVELFIQKIQVVNYSVWNSDLTTQLYSWTFKPRDLYRRGYEVNNNFVRASFADLMLSAGTYALSIWDFGDPESTLAWHTVRNGSGTSTQCFNADWTSCSQRTDLTLRIIGYENEVSEVPLPAAGWLLIASVSGLISLSRKQI